MLSLCWMISTRVEGFYGYSKLFSCYRVCGFSLQQLPALSICRACSTGLSMADGRAVDAVSKEQDSASYEHKTKWRCLFGHDLWRARSRTRGSDRLHISAQLHHIRDQVAES